MTECYRCGSDDHLYRDCNQDQAQPTSKARDFDDHMSRIGRYVRQWWDGEISMYRKRDLIAAENLQWYGQHTTRNGICLTRAP